MDEKLQNILDEVDVINARNDDCISKIESNYDKDSEDELYDKKIRRAVLSGTTPTANDTGCKAHCGQPTISTCRMHEIEDDSFISTGRKSNIYEENPNRL